MNKAILIIGIVVMALFGFVAVNLITSQQTGSEVDYYLVKDTTEAAMNDALDYDFYSKFGLVRMDKEKFLENFVRRFADGTDTSGRGYTLEFYDINETPPKVTVVVKSNNNFINKNEQAEIVTKVNMIMETNYKIDTWSKHLSDKNNKTSTRILTSKEEEELN